MHASDVSGTSAQRLTASGGIPSRVGSNLWLGARTKCYFGSISGIVELVRQDSTEEVKEKS